MSLALNLLKSNEALQVVFQERSAPVRYSASNPPPVWSLEMSLKEAEAIAETINCPEILTLRKHFSKEVRALAQLLGNDTERVDYTEMEQILGFGEDRAIKIALVRVKNARFNTDDIEEEEVAESEKEEPKAKASEAEDDE